MNGEEQIDLIVELTMLRPRDRYAPSFEKAWAKEFQHFPLWAVIDALRTVMSLSDPFIPTIDAVKAELARMGVSAIGETGAAQRTREEREVLHRELAEVQRESDQHRTACATLSDEEFLHACEAAFAEASPDLQSLKSIMLTPTRAKRRTPELLAMVALRLAQDGAGRLAVARG